MNENTLESMKEVALGYSRRAELIASHKAELAQLDAELAPHLDALEKAVKETDQPISAYGYIAHMKNGKKKIDHETLAHELKAPFYIVHDFTKYPPPSVSWALVTKAIRASQEDLDRHTTTPVNFVIEEVRS